MVVVTLYPNTSGSTCRSYPNPDLNPDLHYTYLDDNHDDSDYVYDNSNIYEFANIALGFQNLAIPTDSVVNSAVLHYSGGASGAGGWLVVYRNDDKIAEFRVSDGYMTEYFHTLAAPLSVALLNALETRFVLAENAGGGVALGYCHVVVDYTLPGARRIAGFQNF